VDAEQYFFEDFHPGQRFPGSPHLLDADAFGLFAKLTGDAHPLHYDPEYARNTRFGAPLAHGLLLMATTALGAGTLSRHLESSMVALLEQGARFLKPVLLGDAVTPELEVAETRPTKDGATGIVMLKARLVNQRGELVLEGFHIYLVKRRSG
jgi:acyl dehydratase